MPAKPVTAPPKPVLKSATFWTTNGPAGAFAYWALFEGRDQPGSLRIAALLVAGALFALHGCLRSVNKNVVRICRVFERHPWLALSLPAGGLLNRLSAWAKTRQDATSTPSPPPSRP